MKSHSELFDELVEIYKTYCNNDLNLITKAYETAQLVYYNEYRLSKIPFINHCLNTAILCAEFQLDAETLAAAILHDAFTFGITKEEIVKEVGKGVADFLVNLEKIKTIRNRYLNINISEKSLYEDYLRRMILVIAKDIRVVLLRLFEKYDSIHDCEFLSNEKKEQVIKNMLDIYAPLAEMLGLFSLKTKMENVAFEKQNPLVFSKYKKILKLQKSSNAKKFEDFERKLKSDLAINNIPYVKVYGRVKGEYSFYNKVKKYIDKYHCSEADAINLIHDKIAFSLILHTENDCYLAYSLLKHKFNLIDEETDDYIKLPKPNGYKSIHTIIDLGGKNYVEVQIKTNEMHEHNEYGGASHAFYKLYGVSKVSEDKISFLKNLINWQQNLKMGNKEFTQLEATIITITPKGDVIELPIGSTVLDFAYYIHTAIGEKAVRAKVNGNLVKINQELHTGDVVEVITDRNVKGPKHEHLNFVTTKEARLIIKKKVRGKI